MTKHLSFFIFLLFSFSIQTYASGNIGFREILLDQESKRPLHIVIWYPTNDVGNYVIVGENPAYYGTSILKEATPLSEKYPLVVLSHGYRGSWRNLNWLAGELVKKGFVVAAPTHPETTTQDKSPLFTTQLWERPQDLSRVIDFILDESDFTE
ncbi:alpha/beta hydrolase family protein [Xenorhabdus budapestensis]|uniref:Lipoprotein signal peptide n=1 Tax=Xenorhabdus budapestensis TaxID=290110 RepID=A0A2D0IZD3_XENBU|nr:hypothetical protein [Xenorhabdus budapestensis]PHM27304.1 lipoprotein signal peptide [Xenorhabdus budapestensis]